jgi:hypothetical protein
MAFTVRAEAIVPEGFKVDKVRSEVSKVLIAEGKKDRATLNKTVEGWRSETPAMVYETKITAKEASVWIGPKGGAWSVQKWVQIDEGTEPHDIVSSTWMRFPYQGRGQSYLAKTKPRQFSSSGPGQKLGPYTKTKVVRGHSIEAREWSKTLAEKRIEPFADAVQDAVNKGMGFT